MRGLVFLLLIAFIIAVVPATLSASERNGASTDNGGATPPLQAVEDYSAVPMCGRPRQPV